MGLVPSSRVARYFSLSLRLIAMALVIGAAFALRSPSPSDPPLLQRRIAVVDFRGTPLEKAITQLGSAVGAKVVIDRKALAAAGVNLSEPIDLRLRDVELATAFDQLNFARPAPFTMEQRAKELYVTTATAPPSVIRVYDVSDLFDRWVLSRYWAASAWPEAQERMEEFTRMISVSLRLFDRYNGSDEWIDSAGKQIIVYGRVSRHQQVEQLLSHLREADAEQSSLGRFTREAK